ncbi:MAG TPA: 50S ribosomal protein L10 [Planctomycetota bacterium]|jgi:large subunit ribosomal protein L10
MADKRPADQKPKGSGNPNRINRLLVKKAATEYGKLTNMVVLTNLNLNSEQNAVLRVTVREKKTRLHMVRNRLAMKAFGDLGLKDAQKLFVGPTCIIDAEDPVTAAKVGVELVEKFKKSLKLTGGLLEGKILSSKDVEELSKSKTRPELLADVVMLAKSPGSRVASQLKGPGGRIAGAIKALIEKLEKAEAAVPAAPAVAEPAKA